MKALIFAAGQGTRLQPITDTIPKGLVDIGGKTMLELVAEKLIQAGVTEIVINVHHLAEKMIDFIVGMNYPGVKFHISEEKQALLDTGGGLLQARQWLDGDQPFFIHNVDVLCNIDLEAMMGAHVQSGALATLAASRRETTRVLLVDNNHRLTGWENTIRDEKIICREHAGDLQRLAFSGIHVVDPSIFKLIKSKGVFPILPEYLHLAGENEIYCFEHQPGSWADIGTPEKLRAARQMFDEQPGHFGFKPAL